MSAAGALRVGVIGGGVAGLTTAIALERTGHSVVLFERAPAPRIAGGALLLWANALRALETLGLAGSVLGRGTVMRATEFRSFRGDLLATLPMSGLAKRHRAESVLIARSDLLEVLLEAAVRIPQVYGRTCKRVISTEDAAEAAFTDGTSARFDVLVGADGLHSNVRAALFGPAEPRSARQVAWVGICPFEDSMFDVGVAVGTVGTGRLFWATGMRGGLTYWYATVGENDAVRDIPQLVRRFHGAHEPICDLIAQTPRAAVVDTPVRDRVPSRPWSVGRTVLVGDAAHPCTPDLGQGACQAIESAAALATALSGEVRSVRAAIAAYEEQRYARAARVTAASHATAIYSIIDEPSFSRVRDVGIRWTMPSIAPRALDWLLGGD